MPVPKSVEGDLIYPTHFLDNISIYEKLAFATTWYFEDVLDAEKLHNALTKLLATGDWRKFAGRFRRGPNRKLELHVPATFTEERPAVAFSQESKNIKIEDHPLYEKLPHRTNGVSFHPSPVELQPYVVKADSPKTMEDLLKGDTPALSLHIICFENATIVTLTWCHNLTDAMGLGTLVRAWSCVLAGEEPLPLEGAHDDIVYELAGSKEATEEESSFAQTQLKGIRMLMFVLFFVWELVFGRKMEARILFLPKGVGQRLHKKISKDVSQAANDPTGGSKKVSEHDSFLALWAKTFAVTQPRPRPITVLMPYDMRGRLQSVFRRERSYVQNLVVNTSLILWPDSATGSLGSIAVQLRRNLQEHTRPPQVLAFLRSLRRMWDSKRDPMSMYGHPWGRLLVTTDWSRANLLGAANFAPAVVQKCGSDGRAPAGSAFWYQTVPLKLDPAASRNSMVNLGRDHEGNSWQMGVLPSETWDFLFQTLKEFES